MRRSTITIMLAALGCGLVPLGAHGQTVSADATLVTGFNAQFDLTDPLRRIIVAGSVRAEVLAIATPPNEPFHSEDVTFEGCVTIRQGPGLPVADKACGEWQMGADPLLNAGFFAGQVPSNLGTMTAALTFVGTGEPSVPEPIVAPGGPVPPSFFALMGYARGATAVGLVQNDQGHGMEAPEVTEAALMQQSVITTGFVFV